MGPATSRLRSRGPQGARQACHIRSLRKWRDKGRKKKEERERRRGRRRERKGKGRKRERESLPIFGDDARLDRPRLHVSRKSNTAPSQWYYPILLCLRTNTQSPSFLSLPALILFPTLSIFLPTLVVWRTASHTYAFILFLRKRLDNCFPAILSTGVCVCSLPLLSCYCAEVVSSIVQHPSTRPQNPPPTLPTGWHLKIEAGVVRVKGKARMEGRSSEVTLS